MDKICDTPHKSIYLGDFNLHLDKPEKLDTRKFCTGLENFGFYQHVKDPTHTKGHFLDLVISGVGDNLVYNVEVDPVTHTIVGSLDHHFLIKCSLNSIVKNLTTSRSVRPTMNMAKWTTTVSVNC